MTPVVVGCRAGEAVNPGACLEVALDLCGSRGQLSQGKSGGTPSPFVEIKRVTDLSSKWTAELPPEATHPQEVTFWIVVRDDRGGVNWRTFTAQVE